VPETILPGTGEKMAIDETDDVGVANAMLVGGTMAVGGCRVINGSKVTVGFRVLVAF